MPTAKRFDPIKRIGGQMDTDAKIAALAKAARRLNGANVGWALGASALLWVEGVSETFHDFDLLIAPEQMAAALQAMRECGATEQPPPAPNPAYATQAFSEFLLDGAEFDLLCGFAICYEGEVYRYPFTAARVAKTALLLGESVPLCLLADWFVLYLLMPCRADRADGIARHLYTLPRAEWAPWLTDWLSGSLPGAVRARVQALLGDTEG
jgi:hypothetical protein